MGRVVATRNLDMLTRTAGGAVRAEMSDAFLSFYSCDAIES